MANPDDPVQWADTTPDLKPVQLPPPGMPLRRLPEKQPDPRQSTGAKIGAAIFMTLLLAGALWVYFTLATQSDLKATLPMPAALRTTSAAHADLVRLIREHDELSVDCARSLRGVGKTFAPAATRALGRLDRLRKSTREIEPQLTRDESRSLIALGNGSKYLRAFVTATTEGGGEHTPEQLALARAQFRRALELAKGKAVDELFIGKLKGAAAGNPGGDDVRAAGENLRLQ